jgi:hypothetical protein
VGRPNYKADKRRKELDRQKKQEAKRERRLQKSHEDEGVATGEDTAGDESADTERE